MAEILSSNLSGPIVFSKPFLLMKKRIIMSLITRPRNWAVVLCVLLVISTATQGALISGRQPTGGLNQLTVDNSHGELDALVVLGQPGWPNPICSIYVPKGESHTFEKMRPGVYDVFYILGKGWLSTKKAFSQEIEVGKIAQPIELVSEGHNTLHSASIIWRGPQNEYITDYNTVTITLYPVLGGNIELVQIDKEDFPKY